MKWWKLPQTLLFSHSTHLICHHILWALTSKYNHLQLLPLWSKSPSLLTWIIIDPYYLPVYIFACSPQHSSKNEPDKMQDPVIPLASQFTVNALLYRASGALNNLSLCPDITSPFLILLRPHWCPGHSSHLQPCSHLRAFAVVLPADTHTGHSSTSSCVFQNITSVSPFPTILKL